MTIDLSNPVGERITDLKVKSFEKGTYSDVQNEKVYNITTINFLINGGDEHGFLNKDNLGHFPGPLDTDVFQAYIKLKSPIVQGVEGRITKVFGASSDATRIRTYNVVMISVLYVLPYLF